MSASIRIVATEMNHGREITLKNLKNLQIVAALDSPAGSMSALLSPEAPFGPLGGIRVCEGEKLLFEGKIDSQKSTISKAGILIQLDARSAGALLLDNQALPCVMLRAQLTTVFNRFIAPYGFTVYNPHASRYLPMYTVHAGMSEWDALVYFTRRVYGVTPYVKYSQIMLARPPSRKPLVISNTGEGVNYVALSHTLTPYSVLSQVYLRDEAGLYSSVVNNSAAVHTKAVRKRYLVPPNEYVDRPALSANQRIRRSMLEYEQVVASIPGVADAELGQDVEIRDKLLTLYNLMIVKREYLVDENGVITRLTLASSVYYD